MLTRQKISFKIPRDKYAILIISLIVISVFLFLFSIDNNLYIRLNRNYLLDIFFINYTFLGDGIFCCCLAAYLFFTRKKDLTAVLLSGYIITAFAMQAIKNLVFAGPIKLYLEDGLNLSGSYVSWSGHTALALTSAIILSVYYKNKMVTFFLFLSAVLVACSRLYLADHHLTDILSGALIGILSGLLSCYYFYKKALKTEGQAVILSKILMNIQ